MSDSQVAGIGTAPASQVNSYYAATAHPAPVFPSLRENLDVDVAIVGAGFTGINTAIERADRGYRVAVLEAQQVGWGCSGRNGGQMIAGLTGYQRPLRQFGAEDAGKIWRLGVDGLDLVQGRIQRFGIQCELKMGVFTAACTRRQMQARRDDKACEERLGYPHSLELVERDQLRVVADQVVLAGSACLDGLVPKLSFTRRDIRGTAWLRRMYLGGFWLAPSAVPRRSSKSCPGSGIGACRAESGSPAPHWQSA